MVNVVARTLAAHPTAISDCNGSEVGLDLVRDWLRSIGQSSLFGRWQVKVVIELDRCSRDAQDLLLTYLSSERNLLFAGGVAGGTGNGERGGLIHPMISPAAQSAGISALAGPAHYHYGKAWSPPISAVRRRPQPIQIAFPRNRKNR